MRFLVDNALSVVVAKLLSQSGHDAVHVRDLGVQRAGDDEIFAIAAAQDRVLVSADTDFAALLALRGGTTPSVVLFKSGAPHRPDQQVMLLLANLPQCADALERGAVVVIEQSRMRVRSLPFPEATHRD